MSIGEHLQGITHNVKRLCDGGEIEAEKLNLSLMFNQGTNAKFCTLTPLLQNRCYTLPFSYLKNIFKKVCTIKILYLNLCTQLK